MFTWKKHNPYVRTYIFTTDHCLDAVEVARKHFETIDELINIIFLERERFRI